MRKTGGYMKNSLKIKHIWVTSIILSALVLVFFIVNLVLELNGIILPYKVITVFTLIFVIAILVAWVSGDIRANKYRKKNKLWSGPLPSEVKQSVWNIRTPFLIMAIATMVLAIIYPLIVN